MNKENRAILERLSQFAPRWSNRKYYNQESFRLYLNRYDVDDPDLNLLKEKQCVVGEAYGFNDGYVEKCSVCNDFGIEITGNSDNLEPVDETLIKFMNHFEGVHKRKT